MRRSTGNRRAMSLIELIVTVGIMSVVVTGAFQVFHEGLRLFRTNQAAADAQSSVIKILGRLNSELVNADPQLVRFTPTPAPGAAPGGVTGVVFASSLNDEGMAMFDEVNGKVFWQKYVCYYHVPDPADPARGKLYRAEEPIPSDTNAVKQEKTGTTSLSTVASEMGHRDPAYFAAATNLPTRLLGGSVSGFQVKEFTGERENAGTTEDVLGGNIARQTSFDIQVEAGDFDDNGPDGYYIRVESRVTPRG